jgi:fibronectin type 3 domain-containing protein
METRKSRISAKLIPSRSRVSGFEFLFTMLVFVFGCGVPGEPTPPIPPTPAPVKDMSAHQQGDGVQLTFTLPTKTIPGNALAVTPSVEILRGSVKPDGSPDLKSFRVDYTIPNSLVPNYVSEGHVLFVDPVSPEEVRAHPGETLAFRVRTRVTQKRASPDSNIVLAQVFPVPERINSLEASVTETAIELTWPQPTHTSGGDPLGSIAEYHVYRGELDPSSAEAAAKDLSQAKWKSPLALLAATHTNSYPDPTFEFGKIYAYVVRSVIALGSNKLESNDSNPAIVAPHDVFPPAPPQNVVAAVVTPPGTPSPEVDLSWSISPETDLAGYRVYRTEQPNKRGQLLTPELLLSPAYRDTSVEPGHRYWYIVTAVDRAGNESSPTVPAPADITQP